MEEVEKDTLRHFVLWGKGWYDEAIDEIISEITGVPVQYISKEDKLYWLIKTCKAYNINGYKIIDNFSEKSFRITQVYNNELNQLIYAIASELKLLQTKYDLGKPNLFKED